MRQATFFMLGRSAAAHPALARKVLAEGHTIGHHTYSHPLLNRMSLPRAEAEIDRGIAAVEQAVYGAIRPYAEDAVLPLSGVCLQCRDARSPGAAAYRRVRRRSVGERLESDAAGRPARDWCERLAPAASFVHDTCPERRRREMLPDSVRDSPARVGVPASA